MVAQACQITTYGPNVEKAWPVVYKTGKLYNLQDRDVLAGLCGIIGHETAHQWWPIHEFGTDFSRYGYSPTGQDYGGRGFIQTTWQSNYQAVQDYLKQNFNIEVDLVNYPDLLLNNVGLAAHAAYIYFATHAGGIIINMCRQHNWGEVVHYVYGTNTGSLWQSYTNEVTYAANYLLAR